MPNPRARMHRFNAKGRKTPRRLGRARRPRKARSPRKPSADKPDTPENVEAVRHYGDAWDFENYEKESLKALGLFL
jgi:hypothetical protein